MKRGFTHGGSLWKNLGLLFRSLLNLASFTALWTGIFTYGKFPPAAILILFGGGFTVLFFFLNLLIPFRHRKK